MIYEYICPTHGRFMSDSRGDQLWCPKCHAKSQRKWSFDIGSSFTPHFNPTTNTVVSSRRDFSDQLSRANESAAERGLAQQNLVPVDLRDKAALGVTNEGLDATYDNYRRIGDDASADRLKKLMDE